MAFPTSTVARKILMALTGQFMILYVIAHVAGNSTIYAGAINGYAEGLRHWPFTIVLWSSRVFLFLSVALHTAYGIALKLENRRAKPEAYAVTRYRSATFAGRTMVWSGLIVLLFLAFHLLHFTFQVTNPALSALRHPDALGRPDVLGMVVGSFRHAGIASIYIFSVLALGLHLYHGAESSAQTEGLNDEKSLPVVVKTGRIFSAVLFLAYAAIPVSILAGLLKQ